MLQHKMNSSSYAKVHNVSSLEDIMSYHNDDVLLKFRKEWNVTPEEADDIFNETKKFIWLASTCLTECYNIKVHEQLQIIDEMWHTFIQFTDAYTSYCEKYLGAYLHHYPNTNDMLKNEIRHVNEHGITFQEYRFNEYKNQIEKIAFYLGHETVAKWYGDYAVRYSIKNINTIRIPKESISSDSYIEKVKSITHLPAAEFVKIIMRKDVWNDNGSVCGCSGKGCGAGCSCNSR